VNVVAVGTGAELAGFALAGVRIVHAAAPDDVVDVWRSLDPDVGLVILSPDAATALETLREDRPDTLIAVLP